MKTVTVRELFTKHLYNHYNSVIRANIIRRKYIKKRLSKGETPELARRRANVDARTDPDFSGEVADQTFFARQGAFFGVAHLIEQNDEIIQLLRKIYDKIS